jgi:hypothetical protein
MTAMKTRRLLLAFGVCAVAACHDPTAPRLPEQEDEEEPKEESPGIRSAAAVNPLVFLG